jgi:hypothetical protein
LIMSDLTFNIADYRPQFTVRTHDSGPALKVHRGFVVLSPNSEPRRRDPERLDAQSSVVDIRSVRESHRIYLRRGKVLRFNTSASHRVYMMPAHHLETPADDDPGPMVA